MTTVWRDVAMRLHAGDAATPELDARLLVAHATGLDAANVLSLSYDSLSPTSIKTLEAYVARRISGEPVSRIVGERGFWNHSFLISPATLDPRPDSETLVELTLRIAAYENWTAKPFTILDLGTGSGCLLLSLLDELPHARGLGVDISADALVVARQNAERIGVSDRVGFQTGNWFSGINETFDVIVSNPPYIETADMQSLMPEVKHYDPQSALDGGPDGLDAYRAIVTGAVKCAPKGWLVFECGQGQTDDVANLMAEGGFVAPVGHLSRASDLGGVERCVAGRIHCEDDDHISHTDRSKSDENCP